MITCYLLMFVSFINLTLTGVSGYFQLDLLGANHPRFALFMILIFAITETVVMYFFISTGKGIKEAILKKLGENELWIRERKLKMKLFPHLMLTLTLVSAVFIHGGAVDNRLQIAWLHGPVFIISILHHSWSLIVKNRSFRNQIEIVSEMSEEIK